MTTHSIIRAMALGIVCWATAVHGQESGRKAAAAAGGNRGSFDIVTFSRTMMQRFDANRNGSLDARELQKCLSDLHEQAEQQKQDTAMAARQQTLMEMVGGGQHGGRLRVGGNGVRDSQSSSSSDSQSSSASAEVTANSINGQGQVQRQMSATGGGQASGDGKIGGGEVGESFAR